MDETAFEAHLEGFNCSDPNCRTCNPLPLRQDLDPDEELVFERRTWALDAAARVYQGRAAHPEGIVNTAKWFEKYLETGK